MTVFDPIRAMERVPPHSLQAEMAVLGSILTSFDDLLKGVRGDLQPADFYSTAHRRLYELMLELHEQGEPMDVAVLVPEAERRGLLADVGGLEYLIKLPSLVSSPTHIDAYARQVRAAALGRHVLTVAADAAEAVYSGGDFVAVLRSGVTVAEQSGAPAGGLLRDGLSDARKRLSNPVNLAAGEGGNLPWRIRELDINGAFIRPSDFVVIGGSPGAGKTSFALAWATDTAAKVNRPVIFASLEMDPQQLREKILLTQAGVPDPGARALSSTEVERVASAERWLADVPLWLPDIVPHDISDFCRWIRGAIHRQKPCAVVLDYLGLLNGRGNNATSQMDDVSKSVRAVSKDTGVPIIALHSMSRTAETERRRPERRDLRQSGQIDFDATLIAFLWRPFESLTEKQRKSTILHTEDLEFIVRKCRRGPSNLKRVRMRMNPRNSRILPVEFDQA